MHIQLNDTEARVIGCLIEKSIVTPDQYPMTLNALTNACNQKSSRDPVMSLTQGEVQHAIRELVGPEKAGVQAVHGEDSNGLRLKAGRILSQKILRCLRISRRFCPAPHRITLMASPRLPLR